MTIPPAGDPVDATVNLAVELEPYEAAAGADKPVTLPGNRSIIVRVPPGTPHGSVLRLFGPDPTNPEAVEEIVIQVLIRSAFPTSAPPGQFSPNPWSPPTNVAFQPTGAPGWPPPMATMPMPALPMPMSMVPAPVPAKRGGSWRWLAIGAAVVMVVACGSAVAVLVAGGNSTPGTIVGGKAAPTTPPPVPKKTVTAQEYQTLLTDLDAAMGPAMQAVVAAKNPATLGTAATALGAAAQASYDKLALINPPTAAATAHDSFQRALGQFSTVASDTAQAASALHVCAGSAALPEITNSLAATALRTGIQDLGTADPANAYKVGAWLPAPTAEQTRRLANGAFVKKGSRTGSGQLKIDNKAGTSDTTFALVPVGSKTTAFTVYIRAGATVTVTGVKNGTYESYLSTGVDWDPDTPGFSRDCDFSKIDDTMAFTSGGGRYTVWTLTLSKPGGGNVGAGNVDPAEFPQ